MSALARPGVLATLLAACAAALHPALGLSRLATAHGALVAALLLLALIGLATRAARARERRAPAALVAGGAILLVGALAVDGLLGHHGTLTLSPGQVQANFDETGPNGRSLGLRPLGLPVGVERVSSGSSGPRVALTLPGPRAPAELTPDSSVAFGGYRFARPVVSATGGVARLRVSASDGSATQVADVSPGAPGRVFGHALAIEEYFPDFALDESRRPFSRSAEPRNPAALLTVEKDGQAHRVFVLQSMPGIHRVESLGLAFSLLGVQPEHAVTLEVHREPAAPAALAGALLLAAGVALLLRGAPPVSGAHEAPLAPAGAVLVALLLLADRGAVLAWSFAVPGGGGRVPLVGVGVLLGCALLAGLAGTLLLLAGRLAGSPSTAGPAARGALWLAAGASFAGLLLAAVRVAGDLSSSEAALRLGALAAAAAWLAAALLARRWARLFDRLAPLALPAAAIAAIAVAVAASVSGVLASGTYTTARAAALAAAAVLGLAALEPTRAPGLRLFAFVVCLLAPAVV